MPISYKDAGVQGTGAVTTYATLYSTPSGVSAVLSNIGVCNTSTTTQTVRIAVMGSEGTPGASDWRIFDTPVTGNDTLFLSSGFAIGQSRFIRVSSSSNQVTFFASVSEIS